MYSVSIQTQTRVGAKYVERIVWAGGRNVPSWETRAKLSKMTSKLLYIYVGGREAGTAARR